ncbi:MAG: hypothetical protein ACYDDF_06010 [Thermoplasmatota archaeon]
MTWVRAALAVLAILGAVGGTGCLSKDATNPGLDNPEMVMFRTTDGATQIVIRGAFKDTQYDHISLNVSSDPIAVGESTAIEQNHTYLVDTKTQWPTFNVSTHVTLGSEAYAYRASFAPASGGLTITEAGSGGAPSKSSQSWPVEKILELSPAVGGSR